MSNDPDNGMTAEEERKREHEENHTTLEVDIFELRAMIRYHLKAIEEIMSPGRIIAKYAREHWERIDHILYVLEDMGRPTPPPPVGSDDYIPF